MQGGPQLSFFLHTILRLIVFFELQRQFSPGKNGTYEEIPKINALDLLLKAVPRRYELLFVSSKLLLVWRLSRVTDATFWTVEFRRQRRSTVIILKLLLAIMCDLLVTRKISLFLKSCWN